MSRVLVIGAGHNGLVCALYLARAGHEVTIFEKDTRPGGAARREKRSCGCIISPGAIHYGMLDRRIVEDFALEENEVLLHPEPQTIVGLGGGESIALYSNTGRTQDEIGRLSKIDAARLGDYADDLALASDEYRQTLQAPDIATRRAFRDRLDARKTGLGARLVDGSLRQALGHYFSHPAVQAAFGCATFLFNASPDDTGTAFGLVHLSRFMAGGKPGWAFYPGGMGRLMEKLAGRFVNMGGTIKYGRTVDGLVFHEGKATEVVCGQDIYRNFDTVVSNCSFEQLNPGGEAAAAIPKTSDGISTHANILAVQPAVFDLANEEHACLASQTLFAFCPSLDYMARAHADANRHGYSREPYFEVVQPSVLDKSLTCGHHHLISIYGVFSIYSAFAAQPELRASWKSHLFDFLARNGVHIARDAQCEFLDPLRLEQKFGLPRGNVEHGDLTPNCSFEKRAVLPGRPYETPYGNVFVCGASQFPGGEVTGIPGKRTAELIIARGKT